MYTVAIENLDEFRREWHRAELAIGIGTQRGVELGCIEGAEEALATRRWRDRTGETARKTRGYVELKAPGGAQGVIECAVPHGSYLADGTPPHEIWPKAAHGFVGPLNPGQSRRHVADIGTHRVALRWYDSGGEVHFAPKIDHPGTLADPFFANAYLKCERVIIREVEVGVMYAQAILSE